jgi:hypothetical protein
MIGYISVLLWLTLPVLWFVHWKSRPRRWLCYWTLLLAVVVFVLAKINSLTYVNRIEEDRSAQIARAAAAIEADRKRKEEERSAYVADVRFVEDDRDDYLDKGGMDEADLAYYESKPETEAGAEEDESVPEWKRTKKERKYAEGSKGLSAIGAGEEKEGVDASAIEKKQPVSVVLPAKTKRLANLLDKWNLRLARWAIWFGIGFVLVDYLRRYNCYEDAYFPLPLPEKWVEPFGARAIVAERPGTPRRDMGNELAVLVSQGATFLLMTDEGPLAHSLPEQFNRLPFKQMPIECLPIDYEGKTLSSSFVFEELWFGRTSFVLADGMRVGRLLADLTQLLVQRRATGARAQKPIVFIWHRKEALPDNVEANMRILGPVTGVHLFICMPE